jgi:hypothetical protein
MPGIARAWTPCNSGMRSNATHMKLNVYVGTFNPHLKPKDILFALKSSRCANSAAISASLLRSSACEYESEEAFSLSLVVKYLG